MPWDMVWLVVWNMNLIWNAVLNPIWLVVWNIFLFFQILGMSSSQLTNSYFSEGLTPPTSGVSASSLTSFVCGIRTLSQNLWSADASDGMRERSRLSLKKGLNRVTDPDFFTCLTFCMCFSWSFCRSTSTNDWIFPEGHSHTVIWCKGISPKFQNPQNRKEQLTNIDW